MAKHLEEKIDKHHNADWHKWAGFGSTISMVLPVLSEFEAIGEAVFLAIGGTSAVSVFAMLMKVGRLTSLAGEIAEEHKEHLEEEKIIEIEHRQKLNERQLEKYGHYKL